MRARALADAEQRALGLEVVQDAGELRHLTLVEVELVGEKAERPADTEDDAGKKPTAVDRLRDLLKGFPWSAALPLVVRACEAGKRPADPVLFLPLAGERDTVQAPFLNQGALETSGVDLNLNYTGLDIGSMGSLTFNLTGTWLKELITDPGSAGFAPESQQVLWVEQRVRQQHFQGDVPAE